MLQCGIYPVSRWFSFEQKRGFRRGDSRYLRCLFQSRGSRTRAICRIRRALNLSRICRNWLLRTAVAPKAKMQRRSAPWWISLPCDPRDVELYLANLWPYSKRRHEFSGDKHRFYLISRPPDELFFAENIVLISDVRECAIRRDIYFLLLSAVAKIPFRQSTTGSTRVDSSFPNMKSLDDAISRC